MSIIDALKEKPEALVKVDISLKHVVYSDIIHEYMKWNIAERITNYLLRENLIVFDETKDDDEIIMSACMYVVYTRKLMKGGEEC